MINEKNARPRLKKTTLALAIAATLMSSMAIPAMARDNDHDGRRDIRWNDVRHDNGHHYGQRARVVRPAPHYRVYEDRAWHKGRWMHTRYNGRYGWWWVVGNDWRYYNAPVYPYPVNPYASEVVYAPPVVIAPPPEPSPGINLIFPLHFR